MAAQSGSKKRSKNAFKHNMQHNIVDNLLIKYENGEKCTHAHT